jgi:hypothetical protein
MEDKISTLPKILPCKKIKKKIQRPLAKKQLDRGAV